jgi:hypothetical protein
VIRTLPVTILIEGIVVLAYCLHRKEPAGVLLFASAVVNLFTQAFLWVLLGLLYRHYTAALLAAELFIWLVESLLIFRLAKGQLELKSAVVLSFCMNTASFGVGWFLPV